MAPLGNGLTVSMLGLVGRGFGVEADPGGGSSDLTGGVGSFFGELGRED